MLRVYKEKRKSPFQLPFGTNKVQIPKLNHNIFLNGYNSYYCTVKYDLF